MMLESLTKDSTLILQVRSFAHLCVFLHYVVRQMCRRGQKKLIISLVSLVYKTLKNIPSLGYINLDIERLE